MPYFCVGESVKSEFAMVRPHSALAHSSKWQLLYAVGKGNKFDDDNGQLLVTCPGFCPGFSRVCLNLHYKLLQD